MSEANEVDGKNLSTNRALSQNPWLSIDAINYGRQRMQRRIIRTYPKTYAKQSCQY